MVDEMESTSVVLTVPANSVSAASIASFALRGVQYSSRHDNVRTRTVYHINMCWVIRFSDGCGRDVPNALVVVNQARRRLLALGMRVCNLHQHFSRIKQQ